MGVTPGDKQDLTLSIGRICLQKHPLLVGLYENVEEGLWSIQPYSGTNQSN